MIKELPELLNIPPKLQVLLTEMKRYKYILLEGGRGCVHKDTIIDTPKGKVKIKDFEGGDVFAYDGNQSIIATACRPIKYTKEHLYKVKLSNGHSVTATDQHRFLTEDGWKELSNLKYGDLVCCADPLESFSSRHLSTLGTYQLELHEDVQHCFERLLGFLYRYWQDYCLCGGQPLHETKTFLDVLQQLTYAKPHNAHACSPLDAKECEHICGLLYRLSSHLSTQCVPLEVEGKGCEVSEICNDEISFVLLSVSYLISQIFLWNKNHCEQVQQLAKQILLLDILKDQDKSLQKLSGILLRDVVDDSLCPPKCCNHSHLITILSIEQEEDDFYYDMFVPFYNNYLSNGIVNHNSSKTQSIARILLYISEKYGKRIGCGRETQSSIEESVYTVFSDLIRDYNLNFEVQATKINHRKSGATIRFKGFREQGSVNIKGWEGIDILWIDEAQSITKTTLDTIIPTIREDGAKMIFTMNRHVREDPVYTFLYGRDDCLHIHIDYYDNPFCPLTLKIEAEECRRKSQKEYDHIWLGRPLEKGSDYLFSSEKLDKSSRIKANDDYPISQRVIGIDFAAQGGDMCVASVLNRKDNSHWEMTEQLAWDEPDPMVSTGKIAAIIGKFKPDVCVLDVGGMGNVVYSRLTEIGLNIIRFDGATTDCPKEYANNRAFGYYLAEDWTSQENLIIPKGNDTLVSQLETIRYKYRSNGQRLILSKDDMRKDGIKSPDHADSLMMAIWGAVNYLGKSSTMLSKNSNIYKRTSNSKRYRV